jgi:hypothetical protein
MSVFSVAQTIDGALVGIQTTGIAPCRTRRTILTEILLRAQSCAEAMRDFDLDGSRPGSG